jgi:uncharacterized protein YndB with AHSA1/START domain
MATSAEAAIHSLEVIKSIDISAPAEIVFETVLDLLGPESEMPDGTPFPMKFEPWPGGRWYRDLGHNSGHFWGHVQVIKPPQLIEICGPLFMSFPAVSHVQYRLTAGDVGTHLTITHRAMGQIPEEHREGVHQGWDYEVLRIRKVAEERHRGVSGR